MRVLHGGNWGVFLLSSSISLWNLVYQEFHLPNQIKEISAYKQTRDTLNGGSKTVIKFCAYKCILRPFVNFKHQI